MSQRLLHWLLRQALRLLVRPVLHPRAPVGLQRRWLDVVAALTLPARGVRTQRAQYARVPGTEASAPLPLGEGRGEGFPRALLYLHGGAYVTGSPRTHRAITTGLAKRTRLPVFAADYRRAPEHPYPAALEDAHAAYTALRETHGAVAVVGDSAGGGLALALALHLRDRGEPLPTALALLSPWVDLTLRELPERAPPGEAMLSHAWVRASASAYLAGTPADTPLASPLFADLTRLPPLLVQAGTDELLLGDAQRLVARVQAAGGSATLRVFQGQWHVHQLHAGLLRASDEALDEVAAFVRAGA